MNERGKLTLLYGGLLIAVAVILAVSVFFLIQSLLPTALLVAIDGSADPEVIRYSPIPSSTVQVIAGRATQAALAQYVQTAAVFLVIISAASMGLAWWLAGRVLSPIAQMVRTAQSMAVSDLSQRIDLDAPAGDLKQLADTFDHLLDRIDTLVTAQQRFVANAAHELRTQLAVQRSAAEIGLSDPTPAKVARIRERLLAAAEENERLLEGLLLLATTDQGLAHSAPVRLDRVTQEILDERAHVERVTIVSELAPMTVLGDEILVKHLVRNLVDNAIAYNLETEGTVEVLLSDRTLSIANTGDVIDPAIVERLFEPFHRLHPRQQRSGEGAGLGLAIVRSIAHAHGATVTATAQPAGGLLVQLRLPDPAA